MIQSCLRRSYYANQPSRLWSDNQGRDIAEYAVMLAVILVIAVGTIRLIGSNANTVFSQGHAASAGQSAALSSCGVHGMLLSATIASRQV